MTIASSFPMMHAIFRLPWSTEAVGERGAAAGLKCQKAQGGAVTSPAVQVPSYNKNNLSNSTAKRKRDDRASIPSPNMVKKRRAEANGATSNGSTIKQTARARSHLSADMATSPSVAPSTLAPGHQAFSPASLPADLPEPLMTKAIQNAVSGELASPLSRLYACEQRLLQQEQGLQVAAPVEQPTTRGNTELLKTTIDAQFSLEILMKHRELRLIEQELAKCQVALEQLRRCRMIPYPGSEGPTHDVSSGVGPALEPPFGLPRPPNSAAWGVTDGPYTRHYAKWLISDSRFDATPDFSSNNSVDQSRTTRGTVVGESRTTGGKRASRNSTGAPLQYIPTQYHAPKEKSGGPVVVHRASDNTYVKLVCTDCNRSDFSSAQGFLNHCRIAHHRDYKSHEQAALACGQPLAEGEEPSTTAPATTATNTTHEAASAKSAAGCAAISAGAAQSIASSKHDLAANPGAVPLVHPFNRQGPLSLPKIAPPKPRQTKSGANTPITPLRSFKPLPPDSSSSNADGKFEASPQAPHLSALLARTGFAGNVAHLVAAASVKVDIDSMDTDSASGDDTPATPATNVEGTTPLRGGLNIGSGLTRPMVAASTRPASRQGGTSPANLDRPPSRKGHRQPAFGHGANVSVQIPRHGSHTSQVKHVTKASGRHEQQRAVLKDVKEIPDSPVELSPHALESNPGLVSDREDDEDVEDTESVVGVGQDSASSPGDGAEEDQDVDVVVDGEADVEMVINRRPQTHKKEKRVTFAPQGGRGKRQRRGRK